MGTWENLCFSSTFWRKKRRQRYFGGDLEATQLLIRAPGPPSNCAETAGHVHHVESAPEKRKLESLFGQAFSDIFLEGQLYFSRFPRISLRSPLLSPLLSMGLAFLICGFNGVYPKTNQTS